MRFFDTLLLVSEQVIEVPKIFLDDMRTAVHDPQLAEQLVEVPTPVSYSSSLQRIVEQNVDVPVYGGGLRGLRPGQSSSASFSSPAGTHEDAHEPGVGSFRIFPQNKKSAASATHPSQRVHASVSSSTPAPQLRLGLQW